MRHPWAEAGFLVLCLFLSGWLGDFQASPAATAAALAGASMWVFADPGRRDFPCGLFLGGVIGVLEWPDGPAFWLRALPLICVYVAWWLSGDESPDTAGA